METVESENSVHITYRGFGDTIPVSCDDTTRVTLLNKVDNNELLGGKG